jgi:hypothetical protein
MAAGTDPGHGVVPPGGIVEPVARPLARTLRRAVVDHARDERRRRYPPVLHVGVPGAAVHRFATDPAEPLDHSLRTDVVEALLAARQVPPDPLLWLTRPGSGALDDDHEADVQWTAAVLAAAAELGRPLALVVVTRRSWRDPRTGVCRRWERARQR